MRVQPVSERARSVQVRRIVKEKQRSKLGWLWENMKGYRAVYVIGILGTMAYNVMQLAVPYATQQIVDLFLTGEDAAANLATKRELFYQLVIAMVVLTFLRTVIVYAVCMDIEHVSQKVLYRIRTYLFDKIEHQDMKFYSTFRTGDLMTRLTGAAYGGLGHQKHGGITVPAGGYHLLLFVYGLEACAFPAGHSALYFPDYHSV